MASPLPRMTAQAGLWCVSVSRPDSRSRRKGFLRRTRQHGPNWRRVSRGQTRGAIERLTYSLPDASPVFDQPAPISMPWVRTRKSGWPPISCMAMTRRFRCWLRVWAKPGLGDYGPMCAMAGPMAQTKPRPPCSSIHPTARGCIRSLISKASRVFCTGLNFASAWQVSYGINDHGTELMADRRSMR